MVEHPGGIFFDGYCPACKTGKAKVARTERPIQQVYCPRCGVRWKVLSVNLYFEGSLQTAAALDEQAQEIKRKFPFLTQSR